MEHIATPHQHHSTYDAGQLKDRLDAVSDFQQMAELLKQLGDSSRLRIFWLLCHCEECVINIAALTDMTTPAVSHHLRQLKAAGLVVSHREKKEVFYRAADNDRSRLLHEVIEKAMQITCPQS